MPDIWEWLLSVPVVVIYIWPTNIYFEVYAVSRQYQFSRRPGLIGYLQGALGIVNCLLQ